MKKTISTSTVARRVVAQRAYQCNYSSSSSFDNAGQRLTPRSRTLEVRPAIRSPINEVDWFAICDGSVYSERPNIIILLLAFCLFGAESSFWLTWISGMCVAKPVQHTLQS